MEAALASGVCAAALGLVFGWNMSLLVVLPLVPVSVALTVIDWRTRLLPTRLIAPAYAVTVVAVLVAWLVDGRDLHDLERTALGWLVYGGMFFLLWFVYPRGLGYGDVRLAGVLGLALGWVGWAELLLGIWSASCWAGSWAAAGWCSAGATTLRPVHAVRRAPGRRSDSRPVRALRLRERDSLPQACGGAPGWRAVAR